MILSIVGVCAVIVPALLLWFISSHARQEPQINKNKRSVNVVNVQMSAQNKPANVPVIATPTPTPKTATSSAVPNQGTSSAN